MAAGWTWKWAASGSPVGLWVEGLPEATVHPSEGAEALGRILHALANLPAEPPASDGEAMFPEGKAIWIVPAVQSLPAGQRGVVVPSRPLPSGPSQVEWAAAAGGLWLPAKVEAL